MKFEVIQGDRYASNSNASIVIMKMTSHFVTPQSTQFRMNFHMNVRCCTVHSGTLLHGITESDLSSDTNSDTENFDSRSRFLANDVTLPFMNSEIHG